MSNLRFMKTFAAVARHGSFAAAAEHLAMTQSAVSMQMRALEEEFDHPLFDRVGRSVALNAMGRLLLPHAEQLLAQYQTMRTLAAGIESTAGPVTIGAVESAVSALARAVSQIKQAQPHLEILIQTARSIELTAKLDAGEIDCAVLVEASGRRPAGVRWTPLYREPLVLLASSALKTGSVAKLLETERFLRFDRTQRTGALIDRAVRRQHVKVSDFLELSSIEGIVALVRQRVGIAVVPMLRSATWAQDDSLRILPLPGMIEQRSIGLLERTRHDKMGITTAIAQQVMAQG
ncbi:LysR family transcriptional regulator [Pandoraea apista]|uniref:LysR family transcriptional regulator n=1 Tax=Pandoraea apista TaxID=93218 RepID=A0A5E5P824_9BURK|nr:LysR family transcriptional regulator [Pandoraea apista]AJE97955.1 LysR family transcriptional regulator [Pandoraea apista]AKH71953.1 LysR family transcriptional regulator [Pandoraea apista]AKI64228.1 LysR family transcriptional regulator [Pandoraea apista]AVF38519.1 LysR family transcriptional regulator [Pandoraea apista]OXS94611.1 LysR family transcriptional regulator [Pandoraea apista]